MYAHVPVSVSKQTELRKLQGPKVGVPIIIENTYTAPRLTILQRGSTVT